MSEEKPDHEPVRRVVTGRDSSKVAKVLIDVPATNRKFPPSGTVSTLIWATDRTPADNAIGEDAEDMGARMLGTAPPPNGTRFTVNDFPPGNTGVMHRTDTVTTSGPVGRIDMVMDDSRSSSRPAMSWFSAANAAWVNRGTEVARGIRVIDVKPLGIGKPVTEPQPQAAIA
jgi:hypothetical protein